MTIFGFPLEIKGLALPVVFFSFLGCALFCVKPAKSNNKCKQQVYK